MMSKKNNQGFVDIDDAQLDGAGQQAVRKVVQALPEDGLSMAWRSSLNEQLLSVAVKQRKRQRLLWAVRPALGLSLAMALTFAIVFQPSAKHPQTTGSRGIESAILSDHHNSATLTEVSSVGLNANETDSDINTQDPSDEVWNETDIESL